MSLLAFLGHSQSKSKSLPRTQGDSFRCSGGLAVKLAAGK